MSEFYCDYEEEALREIYGDAGFCALSTRVKLLYAYAMRDDRVMMLALIRQLNDTDCAQMIAVHRETLGYLLQSKTFRGDIEWLAQLVELWRAKESEKADKLLKEQEHANNIDARALHFLLQLRESLAR